MFLHLQLSLINTTLDGAAYSGKATKIRVKTDMLFLSACSPGYLYNVVGSRRGFHYRTIALLSSGKLLLL
ncbi:MAG: hypothetical protein COX16_13715 [Deltaproteobacteria bacterium CG23_combo_of_CG06-09_8_20_14_all_51_20]|nr:MAG: hypothetical protein COX16_13715 [Deltaproteobacteria bacterium CG23_combo_of_CG06-09_8_20_14_all_51_20]PIY26704.1 MAG: hypothetical protein COZ11_01945 [Deltaproteobacteria bacterium CG_4_10_14_3_um_filter_51_14]